MRTIMSVPTGARAGTRLSDDDDDAPRLRPIITCLGWPTFPGSTQQRNDNDDTMYPHWHLHLAPDTPTP